MCSSDLASRNAVVESPSSIYRRYTGRCSSPIPPSPVSLRPRRPLHLLHGELAHVLDHFSPIDSVPCRRLGRRFSPPSSGAVSPPCAIAASAVSGDHRVAVLVPVGAQTCSASNALTPASRRAPHRRPSSPFAVRQRARAEPFQT